LSYAANQVASATATTAVTLSPAALKVQTAYVKYLLDKGANPNVKGTHDTPALHMAIRLGSTGIMQLLIERGAPIDSKNPNDSRTPLMTAIGWSNSEAVGYLVSHGAKVNDRNRAGETALMLAVKRWYLDEDIIRLLVKHGASLNAKNYAGESVLRIAAKSSEKKDVKQRMLQMLKKLGAKA